MCRYLRSVVIQDVVIPEGFCVAVNGETLWVRNQRPYKQYVVTPDVIISEVYCIPFWDTVSLQLALQIPHFDFL